MSKLSTTIVTVLAAGALCATGVTAVTVNSNLQEQTREIKAVNKHIDDVNNEIDAIQKDNANTQKQLKSLKDEQVKQAKDIEKSLK